MKKKLVLVVAVVLVAITACACLAGCIPNRPDRFIGTWLASDKKGVRVGDNIEFAIYGGKMIAKFGEENQTIFEEKGDKFNVYTCVAGAWTAASMTKEEAEKNESYKEMQSYLKDNEDVKMMADYLQKEFEQNFTKDDKGWWNFNLLNVCSAKVEKGEMSMKLAGAQLPFVLTLNKKITIPSEAKAALK